MEEVTLLEDKKWATLAHLSVFSGFIIPFGNIILPIVIWTSKREYHLTVDQCKEVLNFQISTLIYFLLLILAFVLSVVSSAHGEPNLASVIIIGLLIVALGIYYLVATVIGALQANNGIRYRYAINIRFIR
ncbi:MAG TPA: DUF4870 domain-containing protein [Ignavibacteriales bacterium]|nr:DUF4870 domain-containing protein [Ignavibacteriales bacterium]